MFFTELLVGPQLKGPCLSSGLTVKNILSSFLHSATSLQPSLASAGAYYHHKLQIKGLVKITQSY